MKKLIVIIAGMIAISAAASTQASATSLELGKETYSLTVVLQGTIVETGLRSNVFRSKEACVAAATKIMSTLEKGDMRSAGCEGNFPGRKMNLRAN